MKLIVITAIAEFDKEIKKMLKEAKVKSYTYQHVKGFRDSTEESLENNWFGSEMNETETVLFYVFTAKENIDSIFNTISEFNHNQNSISKIHIASLEIERYN